MSYRDVARAISPADQESLRRARERQSMLTKPPGSLGRLEEIGIRLSGMAGRCPPPIPLRKSILLFAGDHGVVAQGVSAYPKEVTRQMVMNILRGGAAINVLARQTGARLTVVDAGVAADLPEAVGLVGGKIARGEIEAGTDILACGEMGIGNTTPATAIVAVLSGGEPAELAGPGTGLAAEGIRKKAAVIARAIAVNRPDTADALDVLGKLGGFEIGAMAGAMLWAAAARIPVVVDGLIATSAALIGLSIQPLLAHYLIAGHRSAEPSHGRALERLGLVPLLDLGMRLGEGTGAVTAFGIVGAAARGVTEMATFAQAGVSSAMEA